MRATCYSLKPAEPVVALILPVTAGVVIEDRERDDVLGVLEAEFRRHPHLHRKSVFLRQNLAVELEGHLRLRMQRSRHVDRGGIALGADEMHVIRPRVGADALEEVAQRRPGPAPDRAPALDADEARDLRLLR